MAGATTMRPFLPEFHYDPASTFKFNTPLLLYLYSLFKSMRVSVPFQLPQWYLPPPEPQTDERMACFVSTDGSQPDTLIEAGGYIFAVHFSKIADLVQNLSRHAPNPLDHQDPALHRFRFVARRTPPIHPAGILVSSTPA